MNEQFSSRYTVVRKLGVGGFSRTYLARDLERPDYPLCVIKYLTVDPDQPLESQQALWMIINEARILRRLDKKTPYVPQLLAYSEREDCPYFVADYIEDGELVEVWRQSLNQFTPSDAIAFLKSVLEVLTVIHDHNIIHQDIKPSNLIRGADGAIRLIDFGASVNLEENPNPEWIFGTPGYSSIEQQNGEVSFTNDLYALGMTVFNLLTGVDPEEMVRHSNGKVDWQAYKTTQVIDAQVLGIIDQLVRSHPQERYHSAISVINDLQGTLTRSRRVPAIHWQGIRQHLRALTIKRPVPRLPSVTSLGVGLSVASLMWVSRSAWMPGIANTLPPQLLSALRREPAPELKLIHDIRDQSIDAMAITPDQHLITESNGQMQRWNLSSGKVEQSWSSETLSQLVTSPDGHRLVGRTQSSNLLVWSLPDPHLLARWTVPESVGSMSLSSDGHRLATLSLSHTLRVFATDSGNQIEAPESRIVAVQYLSTNQLAQATEDDTIEVVSDGGQLQRSLIGHLQAIHSFVLGPDSNWLYSSGEDGTILWKLDSYELAHVLPVTSGETVTAGMVGQQFSGQGHEGDLRIWNRNGQVVGTIAALNTKAVFSPDGAYLATVTTDHHLKIWQVKGKNHVLL
jgi:serine/threonine protein kinase